MAAQKKEVIASEVHGPVKPWVYKRLVQHDQDFVGLIAYGLYKRRKTELAESHRREGESEEAIDAKLRDYHDQVVVGDNEITRFRTDATNLLNSLFHNVSAEMRTSHERNAAAANETHERAVRALKATHERALRECKKQAIDEVSRSAKLAKQKLGWRDRCVSWLLDGVQTTLAGVLVAVLSFGLITFLTSDNWKAEMAAKTVQMLTGATPRP